MISLQTQLQLINEELQLVVREAETLGISLSELNNAHIEAVDRVREQWHKALYEHEDAGMDWATLEKTVNGWNLPTEDTINLRYHLRRVFGDNPDSPEKARKWLGEFSELFHASPEALLMGRIADVPQEIGLPRVISFLKDCP